MIEKSARFIQRDCVSPETATYIVCIVLVPQKKLEKIFHVNPLRILSVIFLSFSSANTMLLLETIFLIHCVVSYLLHCLCQCSRAIFYIFAVVK